MISSKISKIYKILYKLTAIRYRESLKRLVPNIAKFNDAQVFELMHAVNTGVNLKPLTKPNMSAQMIKNARVDAEFSKELRNTKYDDDIKTRIY